MARRNGRWFLSLQMGLWLVLVFVRGSEDADEAYKNGRNLVLEYFLPINLPAVEVDAGRDKREVEGSGEEEGVFSEVREKGTEDGGNSTQNAFAKLILEEEGEEREGEKFVGGLTNAEGSGEVENASESSEMSEEDGSDVTRVPVIGGTEPEEKTTGSEVLTTTEMIFDDSEDFGEITTEGTTIEPVILINSTAEVKETTTVESSSEESTTELLENKSTTPAPEKTTTESPETTTNTEQTTSESVTVVPHLETLEEDARTTKLPEPTTESPPATTISEETTTEQTPTFTPVLVPHLNAPEKPADVTATPLPTGEVPPATSEFVPSIATPKATEGLPPPVKPPTTPEPVVEEIFQETKIGKKLEALPGNILQKENLSLAADPLLIANTRLMDSEENVQLSSSEPKRLGAYIVIGLILLSFSSLVGYITFRKRMNRKRQEFESNQESNDTEKALLSLSDYKDNSELEENHLKNNEITPIVVKSNTQINKFEKNTNFSSPKNLNTIANEKNIEKDNVLKSTAENLTQVIIEDSPKDLEEDKNVPNLEKLIVKTRIDQDSIPKKPIIINRTSAGYLPIPQDNS